MPQPSEPLGIRFRRYGGETGVTLRYHTHQNQAVPPRSTERLATRHSFPRVAEGLVEDRENSSPALLDAVATGHAIRERERRVREMQTREEEEREEATRQAMGRELTRMFDGSDDEERATKRHKGAGYQMGSLRWRGKWRSDQVAGNQHHIFPRNCVAVRRVRMCARVAWSCAATAKLRHRSNPRKPKRSLRLRKSHRSSR